jgi:hypothetical protein
MSLAAGAGRRPQAKGLSTTRIGEASARPLAAVLVCAAFSLTCGSAGAAPPSLVSVDHVKRHPRATWTLPPQGEATLVEVARSREQASDGSFLTENIAVREVVRRRDTRWLFKSRLAAGTYYVHVQGFDNACFQEPRFECGHEWSNILRLVIPRPTRSATGAERRSIASTIRRWAPRAMRPRIAIVNIVVSNDGPWARADAVGKGRFKRLVQPERFALRRLAGGRWRVFFPRRQCPPPGMPRDIQRALGIVCY